MSLDDEYRKINKEFETIFEKYAGTNNFKAFYEETEAIRNNPRLLDCRNMYKLYHYAGLHFTHNLGNHLGAIELFEEALKNITFINQASLLPEIKSEIGFAYSSLGEKHRDKAIDTFKEYFSLSTYNKFEGFDCVFSYRSINKFLLQDLINNEITVVSPTLFNDPVDSPFFSIIRRHRENSEINYDNTPLEIAASHFKMRCFVSNASTNSENKAEDSCNLEEHKNFLMWSHYADSHKGVCIKYKLLGEFSDGNLDARIASNLVKVEYKDNFEYPLKSKLHLTEAFATKASCWGYENEFRLIHYDPNCNTPFKALPLGENGNVEAVYFGLKCPQKDIDTIRGILKEDVAFFQMKEDDEDIFKLVEVPIKD